MSVAATPGVNRYIADGSGTTFAYSFEIGHQSQLKVLANDLVLVFGTNYNVTGVGNSNGGTIQTTTIFSSGTVITLIRNQPLSQIDNYQSNESYLPLKVQNGLDKATFVDQMLDEKTRRSLKFKESSSFVDVSVDDPTAGGFLYWNGTTHISSGVPGGISIINSAGGAVVSPVDYGAYGDDVHDDTLALQNMFMAVQTAGGGTVNFPYNKTYKVYSGAQALTSLGVFQALRGITINMNGSQIKNYHNFVGTGVILDMFTFDGCKDIVLLNMDFKQVIPVTVPPVTVEGITGILFLRACYDIFGMNIKIDGGVMPLFFQRNTITEALSMQSGRAFFANISSTNSIYGFACGDSGNDICIRNLQTNNVNRSYFVYGCNNHDVEITSTSPQSNDVLLAASVTSAGTPTNALSNIKLRYKMMGRTIAGGSTYLTIGNSVNIANGEIRNINAEVDMDLTGEATSLKTAVTFIKAGAAVQNLLFEKIYVHGSIRNAPNLGGDLIKIFAVENNPWNGETARNIVVGPFEVNGSTTPSFSVNLHTFRGNDDRLTLRDIGFPGSLLATNQTAGNLAVYNSNFGNARAREVLLNFTPTWTSSGTQPAIGNGNLNGVFRRYGKAVTVTIRMTPGSTTTFGTGIWEFGIPAAGFYLNDPLAAQSTGSAWGVDSGTAHYSGVVVSKQDLSAAFWIFTSGGLSQWQSNTPFTWSNGDDLIMTITYPVN